MRVRERKGVGVSAKEYKTEQGEGNAKSLKGKSPFIMSFESVPFRKGIKIKENKN